MKKQKKLVVGNWKMNPLTLDEAKDIVGSVKRTAGSLKKTQVVICPPFVYLSAFSKTVGGNLFLGAQDVFWEAHGSFTGEVSAPQISQFKTTFVIVGHSERRKAGESDEIINKKVRATVVEDMTAILCVGETVHDTHGEYLNTVRSQIINGLRDISKKSLSNIVIAYEPVWAVGAKEAMRPREIHEMSIFIKKVLREIYGVASDDVRILYGGDVTDNNISEIMTDGFVQGVLVGRESLKLKDFTEIIKAVDTI